jgi:threonylcarbamoyladenosine tRNA methylthiotransferase MtaB
VTTDVITFGCRLNLAESEEIRAQAAADGVTNAVVFNTCAVTSEAVRQARQAIRKARRERPDARLIVTGCAAQIDPKAFAAMAEVDLVLGNADKARSGALMTHARVLSSDIMAERGATPSATGPQERARAFVAVQNGCDHRCTFCVIPFGRGNSRSVPTAQVVDQIRRLSDAGNREVVLTGVDVTSWGADLPGTPVLGDLVSRILKEVPQLERLRLSSIDAAEIDDALMRCLAEEPRLMPHLHLSLQAGDDLILKRMKRRHLRADALKLIAAVRAVRPDVAFGADLIAGFPTETEEAFENTLGLVREGGLSYVHAFPFSPRPETPAARMPQLDKAVIKDRAARLRAEGDAALARHLDARVGAMASVLVEKTGVGRAEDFTEVVVADSHTPGSIVRLTLTGSDGRRALAASLEPSPSHLLRGPINTTGSDLARGLPQPFGKHAL